MSGWADLPPDILGDVSSRLRDAADFTRSHAVCTAWRNALLSVATAPASRPPFLPWLLTPSKGLILRCTVDLSRINSSEMAAMTSYKRSREDVVLVEPPGASSFASDRDRNWVASSDGAAAWFFTDTGLVNVLTGAVTRLTQFPDLDNRRFNPLKENLRGIVYGDGTIFLYNIDKQCGRHVLTAAILRPDYATWTLVNRRVGFPTSCNGQPGIAYHNGEVLVLGVDYWRILALDNSSPDGHGLRSCGSGTTSLGHKYVRDYNYVLESRGELFWVVVLVRLEEYGGFDDPAPSFSLRVLTLEAVAGGGNKCWVKRDGGTLADRVLFLGTPVSIAADATQLSVDSGCAYFVFWRGLFRYSFVDDKAKLVKQLRPTCGTDKAYVWLQPQPAIAPIHEIRKKIEAPKKKKPRLH